MSTQKKGNNPVLWILVLAVLGAAAWFFFIRDNTAASATVEAPVDARPVAEATPVPATP